VYLILLGLAAAFAAGFAAGVAVTCLALDDIAEEETEDTAHTAMTAPPQVAYAGEGPVVSEAAGRAGIRCGDARPTSSP
jgi:hypothetical protein